MASLVSTLINSALRTVATALHPRENLYGTGVLGALNAELPIFVDGCGTVTLDLRGTFSLTVQVQGSVDGMNFNSIIPVRPTTGGGFVAAVAGTASGTWQGSCSGFTRVRAIVTAYTSGGAVTTLTASNSVFDDFAKNGGVTSTTGTQIGTAGAVTTLTLAAPGAGLRHYLTFLWIDRFNASASALTASATPIAITTTNLPGSLAFTRSADALAAGVSEPWERSFALPLMSSAQNTATTIVCPATTSVIWRITAGFYVAP